LAHTLITTHGLVGDSWRVVHPDTPGPSSASETPSNLSDIERIRLLGVTCDSALNTWRAYDLAKDMDDPRAKRLDYIFINQDRAQVQSCDVVFTERVPGLDVSYSDHFGIHAQIRLTHGKRYSEDTVGEEPMLSATMFDAIESINEWYMARELRHSKWRICHFFASVVVFIGLLVGQWWVRPVWGHFLILIGGVLAMVTGVVDGLIGFLFGRWEVHALREFISEVRLARKMYLG
jgi:sphingomyelin phosphodiesterase 2